MNFVLNSNINMSSDGFKYSARYRCIAVCSLSRSAAVVGGRAEGLHPLHPADIPPLSLGAGATHLHTLLPVRPRTQHERDAGDGAAAGVAGASGTSARATDDARPRGDDGGGGESVRRRTRWWQCC